MRARLECAETVSKPTRRRMRSSGVRPMAGFSQVRQLSGRGVADDRKKLAPGRGIGPEAAEHAARYHAHAGLVDTARGHALVSGIDDDADAARLQHLLDRVGDLGGQLLLDLESA